MKSKSNRDLITELIDDIRKGILSNEINLRHSKQRAQEYPDRNEIRGGIEQLEAQRKDFNSLLAHARNLKDEIVFRGGDKGNEKN